MKRYRLLFCCALLFGMMLLTCRSNESALEESAADEGTNLVPVVTSIIEDTYSTKCTNVEITETINENTYKAKASLDTGKTITVSIVDLGDEIKVKIIE